MSENERRQKYAEAIWTAMVNDEPPPTDDTIWREGYLDAADAVIVLADAACRRAVADAEHGRFLVDRMFEFNRPSAEWEQALADLRVWSMTRPRGQ
jgi:hypothetical protein